MKCFFSLILTLILVAFPLQAISQKLQCFVSPQEWRNSPAGKEFEAMYEPLSQRTKLPGYIEDPIFWRDSIRIINNMLIKSQNTKFCNSNDQIEFNNYLSKHAEMRDGAINMQLKWKNLELAYQKSIEGLNCTAFKEAEYRCATAGNPSHCVRILFPTISPAYAACR